MNASTILSAYDKADAETEYWGSRMDYFNEEYETWSFEKAEAVREFLKHVSQCAVFKNWLEERGLWNES